MLYKYRALGCLVLPSWRCKLCKGECSVAAAVTAAAAAVPIELEMELYY